MSGEGRTEQAERVAADFLERTEPGLDAREHGLYVREAKRDPGSGVFVVLVPDRVIVASLLIGSIGVRIGVAGGSDTLCVDVERLGRVCRLLSGSRQHLEGRQRRERRGAPGVAQVRRSQRAHTRRAGVRPGSTRAKVQQIVIVTC
jgi:hypothetical protein